MKHLALTLVLVLSACSKKAADVPTTDTSAPAAKPAEAAPAAKATPFVSAAGRYKVTGQSEAPREHAMPDPNGGTWQSATWKAPGGTLLVQYRDYDSHAVAVAEVAGFIPTREAGAIKLDKPIKVGAREGRAIDYAVNDHTVLAMQFIIDDKRVYKVGASYHDDRTAAQAFMDAFEIAP